MLSRTFRDAPARGRRRTMRSTRHGTGAPKPGSETRRLRGRSSVFDPRNCALTPVLRSWPLQRRTAPDRRNAGARVRMTARGAAVAAARPWPRQPESDCRHREPKLYSGPGFRTVDVLGVPVVVASRGQRLSDRGHVDHIAEAHVAILNLGKGLVDLVDANQLDVRADLMLGAEIEYLLRVGQTADQ